MLQNTRTTICTICYLLLSCGHRLTDQGFIQTCFGEVPPNLPLPQRIFATSVVTTILFGLPFSNVCMRPEFMTSMSCDSVYCMYGAAWSSRWLMMQLTNAQHPCVLVFVPETDILNILCDYQFVFSVLDELYASHHVWCSSWCSKSAL